MDVGLLFNSDYPTLGGWYGYPVMNAILGTGVLQEANRNLRVSTGDILTFGAVSRSSDRTYAALRRLCASLYQPQTFDRLIRERLEPTYDTATIYCWYIENATVAIADALHAALMAWPAYVGAMDVDLGMPLQQHFFRGSLPRRYRFHGRIASMFYEMGENEDPDLAIRELLELHGFSVIYEDSGAQQTIFDDYDTAEHYRRVSELRTFLTAQAGVSDDDVSDVILALEELHPRLFDVLAAAARAVSRAETSEELAQAALSGRRFLEGLADYLFPARDQPFNGRDVGKAKYKNRLWAYVESTMATSTPGPPAVGVVEVGHRVDGLFEMFNAGLHAHPERQTLIEAFQELTSVTAAIMSIDPSAARRPYLAYEDRIVGFMRDVLARDGKS